MEQVLNAKLRNLAFLKFFFFFFLTISIIIAAVYFNFRIPSKENDLLREKIRNHEGQQYHQEQYVVLTETTKTLIDSLNKGGQLNPLLEREIVKQLDVMRSPIYSDNNLYATTNKNTFNALYDHYILSKRVLQLGETIKQIDNLKKERDEYKTKYDEAQRDLNICRNGNNLPL